MFSSSTFSPFLPSFFDDRSSSYLGHDTDDIFLHHHQDLLMGCHLSPVADTVNTAIAKNDIQQHAPSNDVPTRKKDNEHQHGPSNVAPTRRSVKKKDRHSKICTAQGLRDRRVRLSTEIARQFFGLQDMLGFDKASKTLEWLLAKSTTAIREVAQANHCCTTVMGSKSYLKEIIEGVGGQGSKSCLKEIIEGADNANPPQMNATRSKKKSLVGGGSKNKKNKQQPLGGASAKEVRAEARARARERTREKRLIDASSSHMLNQLRSPSPIYSSWDCVNHQENLVSSKDLSSSNSNSTCLHNLSESWDFSTAMTNMNQSEERYGNLWEANNNRSVLKNWCMP